MFMDLTEFRIVIEFVCIVKYRKDNYVYCFQF
jgi:hypothetical protein